MDTRDQILQKLSSITILLASINAKLPPIKKDIDNICNNVPTEQPTEKPIVITFLDREDYD